MAAYQGKYHIELNGRGYILSQNRNGSRLYDKKLAPSFVAKTGTGDPAYRDGSFWSYFVQTNWRNGSKQLKFDDAGKFWKSENLDTTQLEQLTLSKAFNSVGQVESGATVTFLEAWRSSTSWWNANYGYRQQITITAPVGQNLPAGYPVKVTIDTAALETAVKVRSDRKDWRVLYFNGSSWVDLTRDYIGTSITFFALQNTIAGGSSDSNYYVYYGYPSESTTKQPSTEAEWNSVYGMFGTTPDANSVGIWHFREGSGTSINDDSSNSQTFTANGTTTWGTNGLLGRELTFTTSGYLETPDSSALDLGSLTVEALIYKAPSDEMYFFTHGKDADDKNYHCAVNSLGKLIFRSSVNSVSEYGAIDDGSGSVSDSTWTWVAITYDAAGTVKFYYNGVLSSTKSIGMTVPQASTRSIYVNGYKNSSDSLVINGANKISQLRASNNVRTSFPHHIAADKQPSLTYGTETTTQPPSSNFDLYAGTNTGKVYKWDGSTTWTEQFDCKRILWYETGNDANEIVGDEGGTEKAKSQGFQVPASCSIKGVSVYVKKNAGTPGDITVRIETDSTNKPSGTLVDTDATGTITAFTGTSYEWKTVTFPDSISLSASTTYHIVLKTSAAANDNNYAWAADASSPSFSTGAQSYSTDGGTTWTADTTKDQYFRLLGNDTSANCALVTQTGGTQKMLIGTGSPDGIVNGDARLYAFDGTTWTLSKLFSTSTESVINSLTEYAAEGKVYVGVGPQAKIYSSSDLSTFTLSKDINVPQNPGYVYTLKEYNNVLHAAGGSPEFLPTQHYNGFLYRYDTTTWSVLYPFDFTVVKSLEFYDAYLFIGTYRGDLYVYDTATLNPIFNFVDLYDYDVEISAMKYFDDMLYIGLSPQEDSNETNVGVWVFDRRGLSLAHTITDVESYKCFVVCNGSLFVGTGPNGYVYELSKTQYTSTGYYQSSYFDANLPSIDKIFNQLVINHDPLLTGQSINVYYKFKESDSWTELTNGADNSVGATSQTLLFSSGVYGKKITLKVVLNTTNNLNTPKLLESILQYFVVPDKKWQWTLRVKAEKNLKLLDKTTESRSANEIRTHLEDLLYSKSLFSFTDVDGSEYTVLVTGLDTGSWVVNQNDVNENEVAITILESSGGETTTDYILLEDSLSNVLLEDSSTILTQE